MATVNDIKQGIAKQELKPSDKELSLEGLLSRESIRAKFSAILGKKSAGFISSIISVANASNSLKAVDPKSIIASAAIAATLDLPINPSLGFAHIVPYKGKAQFQMGWRGFVQLGIRTGQYKTMNAAEVYEGELKSWNRITGEIDIDIDGKKSDKVIGYVAFFRLINGFEKYSYMTVDQAYRHGKRYSQAFDKEGGRWKQDFDAMAKKTVLKLLLSKYGILSIEMQTAISADQSVVVEDDKGGTQFHYVDATESSEPAKDLLPDGQPEDNTEPEDSEIPFGG